MQDVEQRQLVGQLDLYADQFRLKLPAAPTGLVDGYVRWAPWLAMVFGAFGFLATLALFGLGAVLSPLLLLGGAANALVSDSLLSLLLSGAIAYVHLQAKPRYLH